MRNGIQLSAATGAAIFRHAYWMGLEGIYCKTNMAIATKTPKPRVRIQSAPNCFFGATEGK
jgi:hypothetical protein